MLEVKKLGSSVALIFSTCVDFLNFLFLDKFTTVSSLQPLTTSLLAALNALKANCLDDPVVFNIKVSGVAILLKSWIKRQ